MALTAPAAWAAAAAAVDTEQERAAKPSGTADRGRAQSVPGNKLVWNGRGGWLVGPMVREDNLEKKAGVAVDVADVACADIVDVADIVDDFAAAVGKGNLVDHTHWEMKEPADDILR